MAIFTKDITLSAGGSSSNPTWTTIKVTRGVIHEINVVFPSGCAGLVYVAIYDGVHPIFPSTEGMHFRGDGETIDFKEFYELKAYPSILWIKAWNEDDTYDHTIMVRIAILPKWVLLPQYAVKGVIGSIRSLLLGKEV